MDFDLLFFGVFVNVFFKLEIELDNLVLIFGELVNVFVRVDGLIEVIIFDIVED